MVTTRTAVDAIVRRLGFDPPRTAAVARRLTEANILPSGAPKTPPQLDINHVLALIIGVALDVPLRAIADTVRAYLALVPHGADLTGAPDRIPRTAGDALELFAEIAIHGDDADLLRRIRIEVVSSWPELTSHELAGDRQRYVPTRFVPVAALASHWQASGHRRSTTINGAALVDMLRELFPEKH